MVKVGHGWWKVVKVGKNAFKSRQWYTRRGISIMWAQKNALKKSLKLARFIVYLLLKSRK